jgi:hypothetical protein
VHLEDLADVHPAGHAERVEHHLDRRAVGEERHVLLGQDPRDDTLVAVAAGHLVAHLKLALDGDVDLDHLDDAGRQLVALLELVDLLLEENADRLNLLAEVVDDALDLLGHAALAVDLDDVPVVLRDAVDDLGRQILTGLDSTRP